LAALETALFGIPWICREWLSRLELTGYQDLIPDPFYHFNFRLSFEIGQNLHVKANQKINPHPDQANVDQKEKSLHYSIESDEVDPIFRPLAG
jgi:hypothetical protein